MRMLLLSSSLFPSARATVHNRLSPTRRRSWPRLTQFLHLHIYSLRLAPSSLRARGRDDVSPVARARRRESSP